jgi:hypothetical protein
MGKNRFFSTLLLFLFAALFFYGVVTLLIMRFQTGDAYPPYSSYRSDPQGTKAFCEGLSRLPGIKVSRNVEPLRKASGISEETLFLFGLQASHFSVMEQASVQTLEEAAYGGGRIVISFVPMDSDSPPSFVGEEKQEVRREEEPKKQGREQEKEFYSSGFVDLAERWGVETKLSMGKKEEAILSAPGRELPASMDWHSAFVFKPKDDAWRTIYSMGGQPVLIERSYGKGTIVLSSDSFFLSNEAMKNKREPFLLSWICGTHQKIVFDETHLGVLKNPGVAALLKKYGLPPFFASLIVLGLLVIWRQAAIFVPAHEENERGVADAGMDYAAGFTHLLRRNIRHEEILTVCMEEWKRSFTHGKKNLSMLLPGMQEIVDADLRQPKKNRNPVRVYREISLLRTRKTIVRRVHE